MLRVVLTHLLLFLLPIILLMAWNWIMQRSRPKDIAPMHWAYAVLGGAVLAVAALFIWQTGQEAAAPPGMRYQPPYIKNGDIEPGQFMPEPPSPAEAPNE